MRQFVGAFSTRTGEKPRKTKIKSFEKVDFHIEQCYAQTASDFGAENNICERDFEV